MAAAVIFGLLVPLGLVAVSFWLVYKHLTMAVSTHPGMGERGGLRCPEVEQRRQHLAFRQLLMRT